MGPIIYPETSVRNYRYTLRNVPEECWSHVILGGSRKSRMDWVWLEITYQLPCCTSPDSFGVTLCCSVGLSPKIAYVLMWCWIESENRLRSYAMLDWVRKSPTFWCDVGLSPKIAYVLMRCWIESENLEDDFCV